MRNAFADALFWLAAACCIVAQVAIVRSIVLSRSTHATTAGEPPRRGMGAVEVVWVVLPAIALAIVLWLTWQAMHPGT